MDRYLRTCPRCLKRSAAHRFSVDTKCCWKCAKFIRNQRSQTIPGATARRLQQLGASLRARPSMAEAEIWNLLKSEEWRWNEPMYGYIPDFYHAGARLIVEIDGSQHERLTNAAHDRQRDLFFSNIGVHTVRIKASDALNDPAKHVERMMAIAKYRAERR